MRTCQYDLTNKIRDFGIDHLPRADVYVLHFRNMGNPVVLERLRALREREPDAMVLLYLNVLTSSLGSDALVDPFDWQWRELHRLGLTSARAWIGSTPELWWVDPNKVSNKRIASVVEQWWNIEWPGIFDGILLDFIQHFAPGGPDGEPDYIQRNEHELANFRGWQIGFMSELKKFCGLLYANGAGAQETGEFAWTMATLSLLDGILWEHFGAPPWSNEGPEEQINRWRHISSIGRARDHLFLPPNTVSLERSVPGLSNLMQLSRTMAIATGGAYVEVIR